MSTFCLGESDDLMPHTAVLLGDEHSLQLDIAGDHQSLPLGEAVMIQLVLPKV